ncbi:flagellar basal body-associated protein FliL [Bacteriovorax sp. BSW11_IV]|uniref:flagellar basal body-associated FliL family protein n=1 Tax=Bacteriovorax sp. BSW11_IV TaxID=1353529 RepID=UPI000389E89F|nr:flagellar basal body-associated FliL family protein [Bacteriovorax sp. BSW11_IV]EQC44636.1 flagellar basal body-associated protein FliL [Bacteriovorax sp. BSW11_IV]
MTGNRTIDTVIMALTLLLTMATAGLFIYTEKVYKHPVPSDAAEKERLMQDSAQYNALTTTKIEKLIINLDSPTKRLRFLEVEVNFVTFKESGAKDITENNAIVNDTIIRLANEMPPEELNSISGKILFENRIKRALNDFYGRPVIKEIFFSSFVVQ